MDLQPRLELRQRPRPPMRLNPNQSLGPKAFQTGPFKGNPESFPWVTQETSPLCSGLLPGIMNWDWPSLNIEQPSQQLPPDRWSLFSNGVVSVWFPRT